MARFTVSVNGEQNEYLEEQADPPDKSKAAVVRELIDAARSGEEFTGTHRDGDTEMVKRGELVDIRERLDDLEAAVAELRTESDGREERPAPEQEPTDVSAEPADTTESTPEPSMATAAGARPVSDDVSPAGEAGALGPVFDELNLSTAATRTEWEDALRAAYAYLQERERAGRQDFVDDVFPEHPASYDNSRTWWRKIVRPGLAVLPGTIKPEGGGEWRFDPAAP
jgi:hypothetical protein